MRSPQRDHARLSCRLARAGHARAACWWLALVLAFVLAGCAHVAPYQRERLAHPSMAISDLAGPSEQHVRSVQEGAVGGGDSAGGGCGCN